MLSLGVTLSYSSYCRLVSSLYLSLSFFFFFFNDTAPPEIYPLSLHDALPISSLLRKSSSRCHTASRRASRRSASTPPSIASARSASTRESSISPIAPPSPRAPNPDRKSTRLNSSHSQISYAVFCLKKKKKTKQ